MTKKTRHDDRLNNGDAPPNEPPPKGEKKTARRTNDRPTRRVCCATPVNRLVAVNSRLTGASPRTLLEAVGLTPDPGKRRSRPADHARRPQHRSSLDSNGTTNKNSTNASSLDASTRPITATTRRRKNNRVAHVHPVTKHREQGRNRPDPKPDKLRYPATRAINERDIRNPDLKNRNIARERQPMGKRIRQKRNRNAKRCRSRARAYLPGT